MFACSFRLTGRFFRERPQESRILLANWSALMTSDRGLAPRAMRDIKAALPPDGSTSTIRNWPSPSRRGA